MNDRIIDELTLKKIIRSFIGDAFAEPKFSFVLTGKHNSTYSVVLPDKNLILRIAPSDDTRLLFYERNMMAQEQGIHEIIRKNTDVPIPKIYLYDNSRKLIDRDYLIMEFMPGIPLSNAAPSDKELDYVLEQVGMMLRKVHSIQSE